MLNAFLAVAGITLAGMLVGAAVLHLIPMLGAVGRRVAAAMCRAPGLDVSITYFTIVPLIVGPVVAGWVGLLGAVVGQVAAVLVWQWIHEALHHLRYGLFEDLLLIGHRNGVIDEEEQIDFGDLAVGNLLAENVAGTGLLRTDVALETALKVKEVSYMHAEGFAGGELKHGVIALIEPGTPCIALAPCDTTRDDVLGGAMQVKARGARVIGVSPAPHEAFDHHVRVADLGPATAIINAIPAQLLGLRAKRDHDHGLRDEQP